MAAIEAGGRPPTATERAALERWHGWGAAPQLFDRPEFAREREALRERLGPDGFHSAARTTLNAHYTDARIVRAVWGAVESLGGHGGLALEAGCGRGTFLAEAPPTWRVLGVELDPSTARIAQALADERHAVVAADFADLRVERGRAQAVVGNVPFGRYALFDREHNPHRRLSIHDHFLAKAASALAPGGVAVVITSRYTLDKLDPSARRAIGEHADFLGAVRLPGTAHEAEAGTRVVTDVVVLRARAAGEPARHAAGWEDTPVEVGEWEGRPLPEPVTISRYFVENPSHVLGQVGAGHGPYGVDLRVDGDDVELDADLPTALRRVTDAAGTVHISVSALDDARALLVTDVDAAAGPVGRVERTPTGTFRRLGPDGWERHDPKGRGEELAALLALREGADQLVGLEGQQHVPNHVIADARGRLRSDYRRYVDRWGPINRVKVSETGRRGYPRMGGFRSDPGWPRVAALEVYDEVLGQATPAAMLERRLVEPAAVAETAATPADALAMSLQRTGGVDLDYVASLLSVGNEEAIAALGDRIYRDPEERRWVPAEEYLAGNVRSKLAAAAAAVDDGRADLERNVDALRAVIPRDVTGDELHGVIGAPWVSAELVGEFARDLCPDQSMGEHVTVARAESTATWVVAAPSWVRHRMSADHEFGLARFDALRLLEDGLNGRASVVAYTGPDGERVVDAEATARAADLAEGLRDRFDAWLLRDDPRRAAAALRIFNDRYNAHVPRSYTAAAEAIRPEGLRSDFTLRPHQRQAIARMVYGGNTLLAHPVGAGKTAEMIVGAMELCRLGTIQRPCFVVPNHMLAQFSTDIVSLYPGADVLAIDKSQLNAKNRAEFAARVQSHDWDAVVVTHSTFTRWPVSPQVTAAAMAAKVAELRADLTNIGDASDAGRTLTKRIEKRLATYEEAQKAAEAQREALRDDHDFFFDESGIDYLLVDEAHEFKNAEVVSSARNLRGVPVGPGSVRAEDLDVKLRWLRDARPGRPVLTMATATPIANTVADAWVMARYLRPELLAELDVAAFDGFRAMFAGTTSAMEIDASGTRFRRVERLARYKNLPELGRLWGEFVDVVTAEQLELPRPDVEGGGRGIVLVDPAPQLEHFMKVTVSERAEDIQNKRVRPEEDNFLKLTTEARIASFDWETYAGEPVDREHSTLVAAADRIAAIHRDNAERTYLTATGRPHPRPGAFQLVFSDLGTPKPGRDDTAYDRLRQLLAERGVPADKVAFVHDHDGSDDAKARFFAACRDGRVAVAVSSTPKMGMGTNVQDRLVALHHLDCPWRPLDIEQREGRIVRQGNQNPTVSIHAYAAERSFAVHGWQTLERKAGFVGQVMRVDPNGPRNLEPDDAEALSYGQVKALATGDPDFLRLAELEDQLARLERLQRSHHQEQAALQRREARLARQVADVEADIGRLRPMAAGIAPAAAGETETLMVVGGTTYTNRGDVARALTYQLGRFPRHGVVTFPQAGVAADWQPDSATRGTGWLTIPVIGASIAVEDPRSQTALVGKLTRLINRIDDIPKRLVTLETQVLPDLRAQQERTTAKSSGPFARKSDLEETRRQVDALRTTLEKRYSDPEPSAAPLPAVGIGRSANDDIDAARSILESTNAALDAESVHQTAMTPEARIIVDREP